MKQIVMPLLLFAVAMPSVWAQGNEWTGFYAGGHLGYGFGESKVDVSLGGNWAIESELLTDKLRHDWSKDLEPRGALGGLQVGYRYQLPGSKFLLGVEAAASWLDVSDRSRQTSGSKSNYDSLKFIDLDSTQVLRTKAGFATERTLYYVTAGWAWGQATMGFEVLAKNGYSKAGNAKKTLDGFTLGFGVEHRITQQLSLCADYSYSDYGRITYETASRPGNTWAEYDYREKVSQDLSLHQINIGLNYSF